MILEGEARNQHIYDLVGIEPDPRYHVPVREITELIEGVKEGDNQAAENL